MFLQTASGLLHFCHLKHRKLKVFFPIGHHYPCLQALQGVIFLEPKSLICYLVPLKFVLVLKPSWLCTFSKSQFPYL